MFAVTATLAAVGAVGATVSRVAVVPLNVVWLPAVSVTTTETVIEPSVSVVSFTVEVVDAPGFGFEDDDDTVVAPLVRRATNVSAAFAPAGQVTETLAAPVLARLMTFAALLPPIATAAAEGAVGATVSFVAAVPPVVVGLPAVSVMTADTVRAPSASVDRSSIAETLPDGFTACDVLDTVVEPSETRMITDSDADDIAPNDACNVVAATLKLLTMFAELLAPICTAMAVAAAGATVSFKTVVADDVDVLPARSVCDRVKERAAPSVSVEAFTVVVDVAPGFTESELDMTVVIPSERLTVAVSVATAPAGHVIDTVADDELNVLITFVALLAPEDTDRAVGLTGATVSFVAAVPVKLAVLPAVSVKAIDIDTAPSVSADALIVRVVEFDGFGLAEVDTAVADPSESVTT